MSIAYGGNWYVVINVQQLGIEINLKNLSQFGKLNNAILEAVNPVSMPSPGPGSGRRDPPGIFYGPPKNLGQYHEPGHLTGSGV